MGRSRRRLKKHSTPVTRRPKKAPKAASKTPVELQLKSKVIEKRLGTSLQWDTEKTLQQNYNANGFLNSVRKTHGRNQASNKKKDVEDAAKITEDFEDDDELRALSNKQRKSGKAPPKKLTTHQKQIMEKLIDAHGEDIEAMSKDRKLNAMQHSEGKLKMLLESYHHWKGTAGVDFRVPHKRLW
mmetsp:Transcript_40546/g.114840  ORF Transcript_40546/g.114840 Transcript_40546/m.114840 type:complete len:184 (-) Transcript_40546:443-994(-)